eukprot:scaffold136597_cov31-Tisochrysis_lutea.AAC.8
MDVSSMSATLTPHVEATHGQFAHAAERPRLQLSTHLHCGGTCIRLAQPLIVRALDHGARGGELP